VNRSTITSAVEAGLAHLKAEQEAKRAARRALAAAASSTSTTPSVATIDGSNGENKTTSASPNRNKRARSDDTTTPNGHTTNSGNGEEKVENGSMTDGNDPFAVDTDLFMPSAYKKKRTTSYVIIPLTKSVINN
jgi:Flp pilus assembly protein TadG